MKESNPIFVELLVEVIFRDGHRDCEKQLIQIDNIRHVSRLQLAAGLELTRVQLKQGDDLNSPEPYHVVAKLLKEYTR